MINFLNKIKQFFKNIISKNKVKQLESAKEIEENTIIEETSISREANLEKDRNEFFEIYNKIKAGQYDLNSLTEEQAKKVITILNSEIDLKRDKLEHEITELNILKADNRIEEKNRIFELYKGVKDNTIDLTEIEREDLMKIRKLLLEESKLQDEKMEDEIEILKILKNVS